MELYREGFASWLAAHDATAVVGYARKDTCCPIAAWIDAEIGQTVSVTPFLIEFYVELDGEEETYVALDPPPQWAQCFMLRIDEGRKDAQSVTARAALDTLHTC